MSAMTPEPTDPSSPSAPREPSGPQPVPPGVYFLPAPQQPASPAASPAEKGSRVPLLIEGGFMLVVLGALFALHQQLGSVSKEATLTTDALKALTGRVDSLVQSSARIEAALDTQVKELAAIKALLQPAPKGK